MQQQLHESSPEIRRTLTALERGLEADDEGVAELCTAAQHAIRAAAYAAWAAAAAEVSAEIARTASPASIATRLAELRR
ncbi:hypothetical protein GCM10009838_27510 [Catenulispora subtropica]|uniref:Uncharacterized protein n=1 Tax=Catenulispora subtropica TaxID=450798 RepID=A0ABP5CU46_9ACTN